MDYYIKWRGTFRSDGYTSLNQPSNLIIHGTIEMILSDSFLTDPYFRLKLKYLGYYKTGRVLHMFIQPDSTNNYLVFRSSSIDGYHTIRLFIDSMVPGTISGCYEAIGPKDIGSFIMYRD